jgi:hypothetical protein
MLAEVFARRLSVAHQADEGKSSTYSRRPEGAADEPSGRVDQRQVSGLRAWGS